MSLHLRLKAVGRCFQSSTDASRRVSRGVIPIVEMSVERDLDPQPHTAAGRALAGLRENLHDRSVFLLRCLRIPPQTLRGQYNMTKPTILTESKLLNASVKNVYKKLIEPAEQVKWNSLYLEASAEPEGEIKNGTVMVGNFKGSGKATVTFQNVQYNREFTHYSKMKIFGLIPLGEFHHTYKVADKSGQTELTQIVSFQPKGLGLVLKSMIVGSFEKRLPESFDEFQTYLA